MSSTNRGKSRDLHISDYYVTPLDPIRNFLKYFMADEGISPTGLKVLDPCAWGNPRRVFEITPEEWEDIKELEKNLAKLANVVTKTGYSYLCEQYENGMSYPIVLEENKFEVMTCDLREDSFAVRKCDFLEASFMERYDITITNPPFNIAQDIIKKAHDVTKMWGYIVMLLRLNYFGGKDRAKFWAEYPPIRAYVHSKRISFTPDGGTDSIEYMHCVWRKWHTPDNLSLKII